jgi:hypothetical protein
MEMKYRCRWGYCGFSDVTARPRYLYRVNNWLDRVGLHPSPPGDSPLGDSIKALPLIMKRRLRRWMHMQS